MPINALTISGPIAGEYAIIVQDMGNGMVKVHQGNKSLTLAKEEVEVYGCDVANLVSFLKDMLSGNPNWVESDKNRADRLEAVLRRIAEQSGEHFATALASAALTGWDTR